MKDEIVVACVLWIGRFHAKRTFSPLWVQRLKAMVAERLTLPHRFVCLSNVDVPGVEVIPLAHDWPAWWAKIELFGPALREARRVLYLDLDVVTTDRLNELALAPEPLIFTPPHGVLMGSKPVTGPGVIERYQTSCISWAPPAGAEIYDRFRPEAMRKFRSDQDWIASLNMDWPTFPREWFRKLRQCTDGPPEGVKVVLCMPWKNDEASERFPWVREIWLGNLLGAEGGVAPSRN